jgi:hypothetical protein
MTYLPKFVSLYHFEDNCDDAIGVNDGTTAFADYTADAPIGSKAFLGDGIDNRTNIGNDSSLDITTAISMGGLIKPANSSGYNATAIVSKINTYFLSVGYPTIDEYGFSIWNGGIKSASAAGVSLDTVNYQAVIGTYDGSNVKIFVNKILRGITAASGSIISNPSSNTVLFANGNESASFLDAKGDEIFLANAGLTDGGVTTVGNTATGEVAEVTDLLLAGLPLDGVTGISSHISLSIYDKQFNAFKELSGKNTII